MQTTTTGARLNRAANRLAGKKIPAVLRRVAKSAKLAPVTIEFKFVTSPTPGAMVITPKAMAQILKGLSEAETPDGAK